MKKLMTIMLLAVVLTGAKAQETIPVYTIMSGIETNVQAMLPGHPEWGVAQLRKNTHQFKPQTTKLTLPEPSSTPLSATELYKKRMNSALIFGKMYTCGECPKLHVSLIATASPITEDGVCLANYHMVHPVVSGDQHISRGDSVYFCADRDGQIFPIVEILSFSRDEDMAMFRVDTQGAKLDAIPLGQAAETGQHISLISHPKQMLYTFTQGYVTRNTYYAYPNRPAIDLMEISADFAEGSSGGPILDDCGNLVAMVKGTNSIFYDSERRNPQMVLKVTIPVKALSKLMR